MCGIAGFWNYGSGRPADPDLLREMTRTLTHRGPDDEGYWVDGDLGLGMRRLEVVDLEGGDQPKANEDGSVRVVFNGEIYNHADLRRELQGLGHRFRSRSDTEVIVHAFEEWGTECLERFNGMFAFALWDGRAGRLLLARDRLGIKPLYVHEGPEGVVFGSELKAVVTPGWVPVEWDLEAVDDFMTYEYVPAPRTVLRDVQKLRPGSLAVYERRGRTDRRRYWTLERRPLDRADGDSVRRELRSRLSDSVRRRLMADVPLGAFLSGGVDSSVVVSLMSEAATDPVRTFSMGFDDPSYNELGYARLVAEALGTRHREELVRPRAVEMADRLAGYFDEPFADVSAFPTYLISRLAREEVTVALSGDGGDELFAGYDQYRADAWARRLRWLTATSAWDAADLLLDRIPPRPEKKGLVNKAKRFAQGLRRPADLEHARWFVFWDLAERRALYAPSTLEDLAGRDPFGFYRERLREAEGQGFEGLQKQLYADVTGYLPDDILVKVDRMSMATSLEVRVPFLDHRVVEYAMRIPGSRKLRGDDGKRILKESFREVLPDAVLNRGKEGFSIPMKNWLRGPLRGMIDDLIGPAALAERGWFDPDAVGSAVREHLRGERNHAHRLWCLMSLELSLRGLEDRAGARGRTGRPGRSETAAARSRREAS